jgi:hypothetical protein
MTLGVRGRMQPALAHSRDYGPRAAAGGQGQPEYMCPESRVHYKTKDCNVDFRILFRVCYYCRTSFRVERTHFFLPL